MRSGEEEEEEEAGTGVLDFITRRWQLGSSGDKSLYPDLCDGLARPIVPVAARSLHLIPHLLSVHHTRHRDQR